MMVQVGGGRHLFHGDHAAIKHLAILMLELNGGVADVVVILQDMLQPVEDAGAFGGRNVLNGDMAGERPGL